MVVKLQTLGLVPFTPNVFVDISDYIDIKKQVFEACSEEMRQPPHSRSIDNSIRLNALCGNAVGVALAVAFSVIREIV